MQQTNKPHSSQAVKSVSSKKSSLPTNSYGANSVLSKTFNQKKFSVPNTSNSRQAASSQKYSKPLTAYLRDSQEMSSTMPISKSGKGAAVSFTGLKKSKVDAYRE